MLFFLSSSARNQYAEDILRAVALPKGARLRFRYDMSLVDGGSSSGDYTGLAKRIKDEAAGFKCQEGVICFLDSTEKRKPVSLLPCRKCKVVSLEVFGPILMCFLEIGDFCYSEESEGIAEGLRTKYGSPIPDWVEAQPEPELKGAWVFEAEIDPTTCGVGSQFEDFASVCDTLARRSPFYAGEEGDERADPSGTLNPFWHVSLYEGDIRADGTASLASATLGQALRPRKGEFRVQGGSTYTLRVFHYYPAHGKKKKDFARSLIADLSGLEPSDNPTVSLPIKSEYDVKDIVVTPGRSPLERSSFVELALKSDLTKEGYKFSEIGLPVKIERSLFYTILNVMLIGLGFVLPAIIASSYREGFDIFSWQVLFIALSGIVGGIAAVFGLRRSI